MNERLGTTFDKDNILITHGSQQGLDLSGKVFLDEGDIVLCESPTYLAAISAFKAYGCSFIELPTDGDGMMMDVLEDVLSNTPHIKLIYAIPTFQNPTGKRGVWKDAGSWLNYPQSMVLRLLKTIRTAS